MHWASWTEPNTIHHSFCNYDVTTTQPLITVMLWVLLLLLELLREAWEKRCKITVHVYLFILNTTNIFIHVPKLQIKHRENVKYGAYKTSCLDLRIYVCEIWDLVSLALGWFLFCIIWYPGSDLSNPSPPLSPCSSLHFLQLAFPPFPSEAPSLQQPWYTNASERGSKPIKTRACRYCLWLATRQCSCTRPVSLSVSPGGGGTEQLQSDAGIKLSFVLSLLKIQLPLRAHTHTDLLPSPQQLISQY